MTAPLRDEQVPPHPLAADHPRPARVNRYVNRQGALVVALRRWLADPGSGAAARGPGPHGPGPRRALGPPPSPAEIIGTSGLRILAALALGFLVQVTVLGTLKHNRDQSIAYDELRLALAEGTAAVAPAGSGAPIEAGTPLARLTIPDIGVKEVVLSGTTSGVLRSGVGHRRDTVLPGQAGVSILMGRRMSYGAPFGRIGELAPGAQILVVTGQGEWAYRVLGSRRAGDPAPPALTPGSGRITLMTTVGPRFAPTDVLRVDADLEGPAAPAAMPAYSPATLPASERALAREPGALGSVTGWGVLLAAGSIGTVWLRVRWGRWQAWLVAVPTLGFLGIMVIGHASRLLPNLL